MIYWLNSIKSIAAAKRLYYNLEYVVTTVITEISCNFKNSNYSNSTTKVLYKAFSSLTTNNQQKCITF